MLYFKTIMKKISENIKFDPSKMYAQTEQKLEKLDEIKNKLQNQIENGKNKLVKAKTNA